MASRLLRRAVGMENNTPLVEAFLLIEQPRQRLGHWIRALTPLDAPSAPLVEAVVAYYDPTCDQALINLQYDERALGPERLRYVVDVALFAEIGMVQPAELSEGERVRFLAERLPRCTVRVTHKGDAVGALTELVRLIRDSRRPAGLAERRSMPALTPPTRPSRPPRASRSSSSSPPMPSAALDAPSPTPVPRAKTPPPIPQRALSPRGDTADPVPLVSAKGTRDNLTKLSRDGSDLDPPSQRTPHHSQQSRLPLPPPPQQFPPTQLTQPPSTARGSRRGERQPTARYIGPKSDAHAHRAVTVEMPAEVSAKLTESSRMGVLPRRRDATAPGHDPYLPTGVRQPGMIYARYLRGGRWVPVRVGALSLKGAALLTGALPRLADHVDVALTFGSHRALVRGSVGKVSTMREAQLTGAATFSVAFELDTASRKQLTALLTAAREAKVTIKPPPPRATRRFPVEWPVALSTPRGGVKANALDVSTGGMFVKPTIALEPGAVLNFSVVLDDGSAPIAGRAKVIRQITEGEAKSCGLAAGYGLGIVEMSESDRMRWLGFLARIERRAEKRVLIGAEPSRLAELQAGLAGCGYAVCGGTDPGALVQLANAESRPADAVLIDAGWLHNETSASLVESLFSARNVPCVTMNGEVRRARQAIDRLLEVVV